ncbi:MAG: DNA polymerase III subunit delta, partial [Proteobacteria bacterium]
MQIRPEQLEQFLKQGLSSCYLVTGAEPLIVQECADAIRVAAREQGCVDRERIDTSDKAGWSNLVQSASAMSLFSDKKLIEVQVDSGKPGTEGSKAIQEYLSMESDDILLIVAGKIDKQSQRAKWYTALDQRGAIITVWPVGRREMPSWIQGRLKQRGMSADRDAIALLAERIEGNLLAAAQEIEKLALLASDNHL